MFSDSICFRAVNIYFHSKLRNFLVRVYRTMVGPVKINESVYERQSSAPFHDIGRVERVAPR